MKFILASQSPRRRELLSRCGIEFDVIVSGAEEKIRKDTPCDIVEDLAYQKASAVYETLDTQEDVCIIGSDTIVVYKDEILGKPADENEARDMISLIAERTHKVFTGVCLIIKRNEEVKSVTFHEETKVELYPISRFEIDEYIKSGDPMDKAGAYGIQGDFSKHIKGISGDYNNVVGLPVSRLYQELKNQKLI